MYAKYHTDAIVLGSREHGEADRVFALYTREFGLVWARAGAVRSERSKMRSALQTCGRATVSLVRGKHGFRLAGAIAEGLQLSGSALHAFARIARLVLRLVAGEERHEYLFDVLAGAHEALRGATLEHGAVELVAVARLLFALGYISPEAFESALFTETAYAQAHLTHASDAHDPLLAAINHALSEAQL